MLYIPQRSVGGRLAEGEMMTDIVSREAATDHCFCSILRPLSKVRATNSRGETCCNVACGEFSELPQSEKTQVAARAIEERYKEAIRRKRRKKRTEV
jgi:hypothetical protein